MLYRDFVKFVFPNENNMVMCGWIEFVGSIRWLCRIARGVEPNEELGNMISITEILTAICKRTLPTVCLLLSLVQAFD